MIHLKRLMQSVDFTHGRLAEDYLLEEQGKNTIISAYLLEKIFFCLYLYRQDNKSVPGTLPGKKLGAYWLDPVTGLRTFICDVTGRMQMEFRPPEREGRHGRRAGYQDIKGRGSLLPPPSSQRLTQQLRAFLSPYTFPSLWESGSRSEGCLVTAGFPRT